MVTERKRKQVLDLYRISPRVGWIAERVGLSAGQTRRVIDKSYPTLEAFPAALVRDVVLASNAGHSPKELAHDFGVNEWKIRQILAEEVAAQHQPLRRAGHRIMPAYRRRLRRTMREFLRTLSETERVQYRTLREILKDEVL